MWETFVFPPQVMVVNFKIPTARQRVQAHPTLSPVAFIDELCSNMSSDSPGCPGADSGSDCTSYSSDWSGNF